ncbi:MAG: hypothetical protein FJW38_11360 [Acidobacteria bacterium]|nr:hypothetical protein [Acidobacteriota bacterium]
MRLVFSVLAASLLSAADSISVVNAADYDAAVAPGSLIAIFGSGLASTTAGVTSLPLPTSLGGVDVKVNGRVIPLLFVSPSQINAYLPTDVAPGRVVINSGGQSAEINVREAAPALFRFDRDLAWPFEVMPGGAVAVYGTGIGVATQAPSAQIGGRDAPVVYAGATQGAIGVAQWNLRVPPLAPGEHAVSVSVGGAESKPSKLRVASTRSADQLRQQWSQGRCTGEGPVLYTEIPMAARDISVVLPLGLVTDAHVTPIDHQYLSPKDYSLGRNAYPVRAPAAGTIVNIQHRASFVGDNTPSSPTDEYRLVIEHSCTFWTYLDLITSLDPALLARISPEPPANGPWSRPVRIPVEAGQTIGRIGAQTLDIGTVNTQIILPGFLVPDTYIREPWKVHTVDPLDYFAEPLRVQLMELNPRKAVPRGGKIDYDLDGRLVGNWFRVGTNGYAGSDPQRSWAGHFSIAPHYLDPTYFTISLGDYQGRSRQFWAKGNTPDPSTVSIASGMVKYELTTVGLSLQGRSSTNLVYNIQDGNVQGVLLVELVGERRLRMEAFPGKTAADVAGFTAGAALYER